MPSTPRPAAEIDVTAPLVRQLLADQHPDLADLPLLFVASGWDNVVFRLGDTYAVRLPRRRAAVPLIEHEARWLAELAPRLPLPIPVPLRVGAPGAGYPCAWTVVPWFDGSTALALPPHDPDDAARSLGAFVSALATPAPADAPTNRFRGVPLADRHTAVVARIKAALPARLRPRAHAMWGQSMASPPYAGPPLWLHGDLHSANVLVNRGVVAAVIDFGDITAGDPATDLSLAWMMFDPAGREIFRSAAGGCDDATWVRARGNALAHGLACLSSSSDDPVIAALGRRTLGLVLDDVAGDATHPPRSAE